MTGKPARRQNSSVSGSSVAPPVTKAQNFQPKYLCTRRNVQRRFRGPAPSTDASLRFKSSPRPRAASRRSTCSRSDSRRRGTVTTTEMRPLLIAWALSEDVAERQEAEEAHGVYETLPAHVLLNLPFERGEVCEEVSVRETDAARL